MKESPTYQLFAIFFVSCGYEYVLFGASFWRGPLKSQKCIRRTETRFHKARRRRLSYSASHLRNPNFPGLSCPYTKCPMSNMIGGVSTKVLDCPLLELRILAVKSSTYFPGSIHVPITLAKSSCDQEIHAYFLSMSCCCARSRLFLISSSWM